MSCRVGINKTNQTYRGIAANKPKLARPPVNGRAPPPTRQRYNPKAFFHDQDCLGPGHIDAIWIVSNDAGREEARLGCGKEEGRDGVQLPRNGNGLVSPSLAFDTGGAG